ncbi:MAG: hypothetical protein GXP25_02095 [Planctomycetes bacterium]|nr:hypothetical protein [Planctomycetota bacterium]
MAKVEKLEREIEKLSRDELTVLREWFRAYDSEAWDRQIEADARAGKLDKLANQAVADHETGKSKEL